MGSRRLITFTVGLALCSFPASAFPIVEDWPQWRGPSSFGVSSESELPSHWDLQTGIAWKATLAGFGASSPVTWGNRIFVTSQVGKVPVRKGSHPLLARDDRALAGRERSMESSRMESTGTGGDVFLVVEAFRQADGQKLWEYRSKATGEFPELHEKHNLATPTPATDGERVYAWFGNGQLVALDLDGRVVWERHLGREYSPFRVAWGHGSSPCLYKDLLILLCDHGDPAYLLALDKRTGKERWKVSRPNGSVSHSTPLVVPGPAGDELIVNSSQRIDAYDPLVGKPLWHAGSERQTPIPSPIFHDGVIYMSRGYRNSDYLAILPGGHGDVSGTHIKWRTAAGASYVPSIIFYQGLVYVANEIGVVTCARADTGVPAWRLRLGGIFFASPVAGDGKIYFVSETGETIVLRAGPQPEIIARNNLGERFIASPAISNGHLYLRSDGKLFAIGK